MPDQHVPRVSVVMAVFNGEQFVAEAVDSILDQSFDDFEFIVVDDASTDGTASILEQRQDPRLVRLTNLKNLGLTESLNRGLSHARGELVARQDADDVSLPSRLTNQVELLNTSPNLGLIGTSYHVVDERGKILETSIQATDNDEMQDRHLSGNVILHGTAVFRRRLLEQAGGYRSEFPVSQDYDLFLRLSEHCEIGNVKAPLYLFRFHSSSTSRNMKQKQLSYRRLASDLAIARRKDGTEFPLPADVQKMYPARDNDLMLEGRHSSFLHFQSGNLPMSIESIQRAFQHTDFGDPNWESSWESWLLSKGLEIAGRDSELQHARAYLQLVADVLRQHGYGLRLRRVMGRLYAERAFRAYQGSESGVVKNGMRAVLQYPALIRNRGLLTIVLRRLFTNTAPAG